MTEAKVLNISKLNIKYKNSSNSSFIKDISFDIIKGEVITVIGESGSGKSTLAKALTGLLPPSAAVAGNLTISEVEDYVLPGTNTVWSAIRGTRITYVFQDAQQALNPILTVQQHFKETLLSKGINENEYLKISKQYLSFLNFSDIDRILSSYAFQLSGGMSQRVCIALAICTEPDLLIADEITSALDTVSQNDVIKLLRKARDQLGMSIMFITHDLKLAKDFSDRILVMHDGEIVERGAYQKLQSSATTALVRDMIGIIERQKKDNSQLQQISNIPSPQVLVEVNNIFKEFDNFQVLNNLSIEIYEKEIFGLFGESGCGKSTLAKILAGLQSYDSGQIFFLGEDFAEVSKKLKRKLYSKVQFVFQNERGCLNPRRKIIDIVQEPLRYLKLHAKDEMKDIAKKCLASVGIDEKYFSRRSPELSTGQCQRVALAKALVVNPRFLILDEITSALDIRTKYDILDLLINIFQREDIAMLMISHDLSALDYVCHRIGHMKNGKISRVFVGRERLGNTISDSKTLPY